MKSSLFFLSISLLMSCNQTLPPEQAATILYRDHTYCLPCGGWIIRIDSATYRAELPTSFGRDSNAVWIRYEVNENPSYKVFGWINIKSIRQR